MKNLAIILTALVVMSSCSPKLISSTTKTQTKTELVDTVVRFKVFIPERRLAADTNISSGVKLIFLRGANTNTTKQIVITKEDKKAKLFMQTRIDSLGNATMVCIAIADSVAAEATLQNKKITVLMETFKVYKERENYFKKIIRWALTGIGLLLLIIILVFAFYKRIRSLLGI